MVFTILWGCFSYANDKNVRECECTNGMYASYYDPHLCGPSSMVCTMDRPTLQRQSSYHGRSHPNVVRTIIWHLECSREPTNNAYGSLSSSYQRRVYTTIHVIYFTILGDWHLKCNDDIYFQASKPIFDINSIVIQISVALHICT